MTPRIPFVPHFVRLADTGASRMAIAVYGAIAAFQAAGYEPTLADLAWTAKHATKWAARRALRELVALNLVRRERAPSGGRRRNRYTLLGPTLEAARNTGETGT